MVDPLTGHGGKRERAGRLTKASRKRRADVSAANREKFDLATVAALPGLFETLLDLAIGVWVEETTPDGKRKVYQEKPDRQALMFLTEHGIGKAAAKVMTVPDTTLTLAISHPRPNRRMKEAVTEVEELGDEDEESDEVEDDATAASN